MSANRFVYFGIAIALALTAAFTFMNARTSIALGQEDRAYDQVERMRAQRWIDSHLADRADVYDQIEKIRAKRWIESQLADRSYDQIETIRVARTWAR